MAHGYLLHQFFSKISNHRKDKYGGTLENRCRFPFEISEKIRKEWPTNRILGARITGSDYIYGGNTLKEAIYLTKELEKIGFDYVCVSRGGIVPITKMKIGKPFRRNLSKEIKKKTSILVRVSGQIDSIKFNEK